jgi:hypothetical protein
MPPLDAKRLLLRMAMVSKNMADNEDEQLKLLFVHVKKKAHVIGRLRTTSGRPWCCQKKQEKKCKADEMAAWHEVSANAWESDNVKNLQGLDSFTVLLHPRSFQPETKVR